MSLPKAISSGTRPSVVNAKRKSRLQVRLLILGAGPLGREIYEILVSRKLSFYTVVGFVDNGGHRMGNAVSEIPILGSYDELYELVRRFHIDKIVVCTEDRRAVLPVKTLLDLKADGLDIVDGHQLLEEEAGRLSINSLPPSALIFSTGFRKRLVSKVLKRIIDVVIASFGLILLSPIMGIVALLIKLDSPGPIFYRQVRVGLRGTPYLIMKFRSMFNDAEKAGPRWAEVSDQRVSRVGRWLRKLRIDEIPQLLNVLQGHMSLVGPRPERPVFVQELRDRIPYYDIRHTVKPGITGWAQVKFRYASSHADTHTKLQYDLYYVKNMSLYLDIKILTQTLRVVLLGEGV